MKYKIYIKPTVIFEEIETVPLCDLSVEGTDQPWEPLPGRPKEESFFDNSDEDLYEFSINLED